MRYSVSSIISNSKCTQHYDLKYNRRISPIVQNPGKRLLGTLVHIGLAEAMRSYWGNSLPPFDVGSHQRARENAFQAMTDYMQKEVYTKLTGVYDIVEYNELAFNAEILVENTLDHINIPANYTIYSVDGEPVVEYYFRQNIDEDGNQFSGVVDVLLEDIHTGELVVLDWKTRASFTSYEDELLSTQNAVYQYIMSHIIEKPIARSIVYQIRSKIPSTPKLNKNGTMSRSKVSTTWEVYKRALLENGLNPVDYEDMQQHYEAQEDKFFNVVDITRTELSQAIYWNNIHKHISNIQSVLNPAMAFGTACQGCEFRSWCTAQVSGLDPQDLLGEIYEQE